MSGADTWRRRSARSHWSLSGRAQYGVGQDTDERTPTAVAPFAIGATVFAGALVTGPLTGGSFNPARSLGPAVVGGIWTSHWLYWLAPTIGMVAAMHAYEALRGGRTAPAPENGRLGVEGPVEI